MITPRLHGNGFIQVDLGPLTRMHVWDKAIAAQKVYTGIHDHRFGFTSTVLLGHLRHTEYEIIDSWRTPPKNAMDIYVPHIAVPRDREDTVLMPAMVGGVRLRALGFLDVHEGESYDFGPRRIHTSEPISERVITIMHKTAALPDWQPRVFVPYGQTPDNDFNRYAMPSYVLARVVASALAHFSRTRLQQP